MTKDIMKEFGKPFSFEEVKAKVQVTTADKKKGLAVFYIDSRAIQRRLDEVVGYLNWKSKYVMWQNNAQLCEIAIYCGERKEWVGKFDGAENTSIEPIKGGLSDSFKRAACMWGIGRYVYKISGTWVEIEPSGKSHRIKDGQLSQLKLEYEKAIKEIFGADAVPTPSQPAKQQPAAKQQQKPAATTSAPKEANQPPAAATQSSTPAATSAPQQQDNVASFEGYKVHKMEPGGGGSHLLSLHDKNGAVTSAYVKPREENIAVGSHLLNVKIEEKKGANRPYNLITHYQVAA